MNWKALGPLLGVILLAALAFAFWPEVPQPLPPPPPPVAEPYQPSKVLRQVPTRNEPTPGAPDAAVVMIGGGLIPLPPSNDATPSGPPVLDGVIDPDRLRELGVPENAVEPEDAGALLKLDRAAFKAAVATAVTECSSANPVTKRSRLEFQLVEIPGRDRSKIMSVERSDAGSDPLADCVRQKVSALRFEPPRGGETRIVFPLAPPNAKGDTL
ncbi:MAG: hypothetical protein QM817_15825 [Archangium sp.]